MFKKSVITLAVIALSAGAFAAPKNAKPNKELKGLKHRVKQLEAAELTAFDAAGREIGRVISMADFYIYGWALGNPRDPFSPGGAVWVEYKFHHDGEEKMTPIRVSNETISGKFDYSPSWNAVIYSEPDCQGVASYTESKEYMLKGTVFESPVIVVSSYHETLRKVSLAYIATDENWPGPYESFRLAAISGGNELEIGQCNNDKLEIFVQGGGSAGAHSRFLSRVYSTFHC